MRRFLGEIRRVLGKFVKFGCEFIAFQKNSSNLGRNSSLFVEKRQILKKNTVFVQILNNTASSFSANERIPAEGAAIQVDVKPPPSAGTSSMLLVMQGMASSGWWVT